MCNFDRLVSNGSIGETLYRYSPEELEIGCCNEEIECEFCNDSQSIGYWKDYTRALRHARELPGNEWMKKLTVEEIISECRWMRDGYITKDGRKIDYTTDCPVCF